MDFWLTLLSGLVIGAIGMAVVGLPLDRLERLVNARKRLKARQQK